MADMGTQEWADEFKRRLETYDWGKTWFIVEDIPVRKLLPERNRTRFEDVPNSLEEWCRSV